MALSPYDISPETPLYDAYVDPMMPQREDFEDRELYKQAMAEWALGRNGGRAFDAPQFMDASGQMVSYDPAIHGPSFRAAVPEGAWRVAGSTRDISAGEHAAQAANRHYFNAIRNQTGNERQAFMGWVQHNPEQALAAYMAVDSRGNPIHDPGAMARLER